MLSLPANGRVGFREVLQTDFPLKLRTREALTIGEDVHGARDSAGEKVLIAAGDPSGSSARHALGHEEPKARAALLAAAPVVFGVRCRQTAEAQQSGVPRENLSYGPQAPRRASGALYCPSVRSVLLAIVLDELSCQVRSVDSLIIPRSRFSNAELAADAPRRVIVDLPMAWYRCVSPVSRIDPYGVATALAQRLAPFSPRRRIRSSRFTAPPRRQAPATPRS